VTLNPGWEAAALAAVVLALLAAALITAGHEHRKEGK
jgi:hypothetical protein